MATEVFNRCEKKYILRQGTYEQLMNRLEQHLVPDAYNKNADFYTISNVYFDTEDDYYIRTSLEKPAYKEKLRLRAYGVPGVEDKVYLEIKKKISGIVNKRRCTMALRDAYQFLDQGVYPKNGNRQVLREVDYILTSRNLLPKLYLAYDRKAYFCPKSAGLRITFDRNIRSRRFDLRLESGDFGYPLLQEDVWLMEVKSEQGIPIWLARLFSEYRLYPSGFSKYGAEYQRMLDYQITQGGNPACLKPSLKAVLAPLSPPEEQFLVS